VDLLLHAEVDVGHPAQIDHLVVGGGGGVVARLGLVRGRTSLALSARLGATAYGEGSGVAVLLDIVSPGADVSLRLTDRAAIHAGLRVVLGYVTEPADVIGGFEARVGASVRLAGRLGLFGTVGGGGTLWSAHQPATARLEAVVGLEYVIGGGAEG
jgi:hypothetical protein